MVARGSLEHGDIKLANWDYNLVTPIVASLMSLLGEIVGLANTADLQPPGETGLPEPASRFGCRHLHNGQQRTILGEIEEKRFPR